jgi:site-specific DNA-adenine methylase
MKNHFYTSYAGNKRNEVINIYDEIDFNEIDTIVEPYCGSCAVSYYIWTQNKDKDFKYVLNDKDVELITALKAIASGEYEQIENEVNNYRETIKDMLDTDGFDKSKEYFKDIIRAEGIANHLFKNKYYKLRAGMMPTGRDLKRFDKVFKFSDYPIFEFLQNANIEFHNTNANEIIEMYDNKTSFLFLDPPYLGSCNNFYKRSDNIDLEECYIHLINKGLKNYKSKIIICHELNWIFKLLFNEYIDETKKYGKRYETNLGLDFKAKAPTYHICIKNY